MKKTKSRHRPRRSVLPLVLIGIAVLAVIAAVVTWKWSAPGVGAGVEQTRPVTVKGSPLPRFPEGGTSSTDPARGLTMPEIRGASFDGKPVAIAGDGHAKVVIFLAHWCPHCQAEVPNLVGWAKGGMPAGVEAYSVSTAVAADRPNYPPSTWLEQEHWPLPLIADDRSGTAASAAGLSGFPFFVFVRADGTVASRHEGELSIEELKDRIASLR